MGYPIIIILTVIFLIIFAGIPVHKIHKEVSKKHESKENRKEKALREKTNERYYLFSWPYSQEFVGHEECFLIDPLTAVKGHDLSAATELDSSYMVPESLLLRKRITDTPYYGFAFFKTYENPKNKTDGILKDYAGNIFVPIKEKQD